MSWDVLESVSRCLETCLKTSWGILWDVLRHVLRRLQVSQDVYKTFPRHVLRHIWKCLETLFQTISRRLTICLETRLGNVLRRLALQKSKNNSFVFNSIYLWKQLMLGLSLVCVLESSVCPAYYSFLQVNEIFIF